MSDSTLVMAAAYVGGLAAAADVAGGLPFGEDFHGIAELVAHAGVEPGDEAAAFSGVGI